MKKLFMRFPEGRRKALTLSYDDGVEQDIHLIDILRAHGLKGTFNLNSGLFAPEDFTYAPGELHRRMSERRVLKTYADSGMEVALHTYEHPFLEQMSGGACAYQIVKDREALEGLFGRIVRGMAYPYGTYSDGVVEVLRACGVVYARTTVSTERFDMPKDWLRLPATCHHKNPRLFDLADSFLAAQPARDPQLFYLWGHSYEFERDGNWDVIERFAEQISGRDDIYYATNMEVYESQKAFEHLVTSADCSLLYNPSAHDAWFADADGKIYQIRAGETLRM